MKGFIHIYTGEGKGKTTASLGLALRAAGAGLRVYIGQFMKKRESSELKSLEKLKGSIKVEQFGQRCFVKKTPSEIDKNSAQKGLMKVKKVMQSSEFNLVILDEINTALSYSLIKEEELLNILNNRPQDIEVVLTGRGATPNLIKLADLVTEMRSIKHYYAQGIASRKGIEE